MRNRSRSSVPRALCALLGAIGAGVALAAGASGCGDETRAGGAPSSRLVDFTKPPPWVNALDIDPESKDFLLTTNRGFFRIAPSTGRVRSVTGTISAGGKRATVGTFLELTVAGPGRLIGSGHPDQEGSLPSFLGVIRSGDLGRTWKVVSRLGAADLHKIVLAHDRIYAYDAVIGALLVSRDEGRTFTESFTPTGTLIIDFEVDPADPRHIVASGDADLFASRDGGSVWRRLDRNAGIRLAWPSTDALYRALKDGSVQRSGDGGASWKGLSRVGGEPYKFKAVDRDELYLALSDGTILHTTDGARTWDEAFRP